MLLPGGHAINTCLSPALITRYESADIAQGVLFAFRKFQPSENSSLVHQRLGTSMTALSRFNSSEDSGGTFNFKLAIPASADGASGPRSASVDIMDRETSEPTRHGLAAPPHMSSEWIPKDTFDCPPGHGSSHSRDPAADPELASILSPSVSVAGPLSRQMSMASARSSVALTAVQNTGEVSKAVSRMSILPNERMPLLPEDNRTSVAQEAAALRDSLAAERPQQGGASGLVSPESPEVTAARHGRLGSSEPCLVDIAEALSGATGPASLLHHLCCVTSV